MEIGGNLVPILRITRHDDRGTGMKHCLILDDSSMIRRIASRLLESFDIKSREADSVEIALKMCDDQMPDCILIDQNMPGFDPLRFIASLRRKPDGDRARVVCWQFENKPGGYEKLVQSGITGVLMKPFDKASMGASLTAAGVI